MSPRRLLALACAVVLPLAGCASLPKDPDETLQRIEREHVVRIGVSHAPPLADITGDAPRGKEVDLVAAFARAHGAEPAWVKGGEEQLIAQLEEGKLDLVVGGITKDTPWSTKAAVTRPWGKAVDPLGDEQSYVVLAPLGENALVGALERFFDAEPQR